MEKNQEVTRQTLRTKATENGKYSHHVVLVHKVNAGDRGILRYARCTRTLDRYARAGGAKQPR